MQPLTVQVDLPSSSGSSMFLKPYKKNGKDNYEVVNCGEINFPDNWHSKRLGRGSYGTVIECFFRVLSQLTFKIFSFKREDRQQQN